MEPRLDYKIACDGECIVYKVGAKLTRKFLFVVVCWIVGWNVVISMLTIDIEVQ